MGASHESAPDRRAGAAARRGARFPAGALPGARRDPARARRAHGLFARLAAPLLRSGLCRAGMAERARGRRRAACPKGISVLIGDMEAPGVEVRPMTQITGHAEFSELFLDEVVVPAENLLGARGQGWAIALHTLAHERGTAALPRQVKLRTWVDRLVADAG